MSVSEKSTSSEAAKKARREELKRKWIQKRAEEEARKAEEAQESPIEKAIDVILTPTYIAVGAGIIIFRKLTGKPSVTIEDFQ
jgi:ribosomal protein S25